MSTYSTFDTSGNYAALVVEAGDPQSLLDLMAGQIAAAAGALVNVASVNLAGSGDGRRLALSVTLAQTVTVSSMDNDPLPRADMQLRLVEAGNAAELPAKINASIAEVRAAEEPTNVVTLWDQQLVGNAQDAHTYCLLVFLVAAAP